MRAAPTPINEAERVAALESYGILDTEAERAFDALTNAAALICGMPISLVSLVDRERQWFKSVIGLPVTETSRDIAFCSYTILDDKLFQVQNALQDERFQDNPLVLGDPGIRFYAGIPLIDSDNFALGTLCVIDRKPRRLSLRHRRALEELACAVIRLLEAGKQNTELLAIQAAAQESLGVSHVELQEAASQLADSNNLLTIAGEMSNVGHWYLSASGKISWSEEVYRMHGLPISSRTPGLDEAIRFYHSEDVPKIRKLVDRTLNMGEPYVSELRLVRTDGAIRNVVSWGKCERSVENGSITSLFGVFQDVTDQRNAERERAMLNERALLAAEAGDVGIWEWAIRDKTLISNERMIQHYGLDPVIDKLTLNTWRDTIHPDDKARVLSEIQDAIDGKRPYETEYRVLWSSGSIRYLRARGTVFNDTAGPQRFVGVVSDVTELRTLTEKLHEEKERLHITLASIGDAVIATDEKAFITFMNLAAEKLVGWSASEAFGMPLTDVVHLENDDTGEIAESPVGRCLAENAIIRFEGNLNLISRSGRRHAIQESIGAVKTQSGEVVGAVLVLQDVSHSREVQKALSYSATHDALTGLCNRDKFHTECQMALELLKRSCTAHSLCFIDLDRFKLVNDTAGHAAGDVMLKEVATVMRRELRSTDLVARLGGDEFGLLLRDCPAVKAREICRKLIGAISAIRLPWDDKVYDVGASIGVATVTETVPVDLLMSQADLACYASKHNGRNRVSLYDKSMMVHGEHRHRELQAEARSNKTELAYLGL